MHQLLWRLVAKITLIARVMPGWNIVVHEMENKKYQKHKLGEKSPKRNSTKKGKEKLTQTCALPLSRNQDSYQVGMVMNSVEFHWSCV